ncbi:MAG: methyl-accepting chemotaxis protein [Faecalicatena sp.]|uniref:methyl-accepting chemotaxis protein n=1 Tax=Faecalicatena sp. TaxID=2005360 RepID=UPI00258D6CC7|nr:methyl-accepting chemotaxis protein [Faecalicatena sp.]MCI6465289.1 methyl-accepting chemotaxis protein [Faecalicatena sp.]MDY5617549.1 methyl-accepting chemotaxis protein [Lachnospiraceae bacterium]
MREYFKNLKVGKKLMTSFLIVIALYMLTVLVSILNISRLSNEMKKMNEGPFQNVESANETSSNIQIVGKNLSVLVNTENAVNEAEYLEDTKAAAAKVEAGLEELQKGYVSGKEQVQILAGAFTELKEAREKVINKLEHNNKEMAAQAYFNEYEPQALEVRKLLADVIDASNADVHNSLEDTSRLRIQITTLILGLAVVCVLCTIILCIGITRSIVTPIRAVKHAANQISNGQLCIDLGYVSKNEFGNLADDIRSTADTLNSYVTEIQKGLYALGSGKLNYDTSFQFKGDFVRVGESMEAIGKMLRNSIQQISSSAELVSGGAEQVSNGAQVLAQGASEQASSIEELAASINEIAESVSTNADNAAKSSEYAAKVENQILENNNQMLKLKESIRQIQENSKEITGIVKEIEDIAFQTNILALNASVEAARAGEAGKGFAVVAGEVRRLAAKTTGASKLTAELVEKNTEAVREGYEASQMTAQTLQSSVEGAQTVNDMVGNISELSEQQADAIAQIRKSVELISDIVQGNSATSEESAAASEELSAQAQILKELVEQFEL